MLEGWGGEPGRLNGIFITPRNSNEQQTGDVHLAPLRAGERIRGHEAEQVRVDELQPVESFW